MVKGVGKTLVKVAQALTNPAGAIASVFTKKKKGLRPGRTAASAGMVRRFYKKRRSAPRSKVVNDGQGNVRMSKSIGRQPSRLNRSLEAKIRDVLNPANHHAIQNSGNVHVNNGQCVYTHFEMMNATDIDQVIAQAGGSAGVSSDYYNSKLNIQNASLHVMLRNQTTNLVSLRVYEYICRRDVPDKILTSPTSGVEVDGSTQHVVETGFTYQQTAQIVNSSLGGTLFQNPLFCTYYKIVKVRNIQLGAGKCMSLSMSNLKTKVINPLVYNATDGDVLAGHTRGFCIQAVSSLIGPEPTDDPYGQPTTGFVNFDWFCSRKYAYNQPWYANAKNTISSNLPTKATGYHINEYTGNYQEEKQS